MNRYHGTQNQVEEVDIPEPVAVKSNQPDIQRIPINKPGRRRRGRPLPSPQTAQPGSASNGADQAQGATSSQAAGSTFVPRRRRHIRTEDDIARDALVEQFLSENRLENVYAGPSATGLHATVKTERGATPEAAQAGHDRAADIRLAEEFRREFMAEVEERKQLKRARQPAASAGKAGADELKGPKLGGSRQQRAAMHAALQAAEKKR